MAYRSLMRTGTPCSARKFTAVCRLALELDPASASTLTLTPRLWASKSAVDMGLLVKEYAATMMDSSALLIPPRITFRDCPLGEKPTSNVAEDGIGDGKVNEKGTEKGSEKGSEKGLPDRKTKDKQTPRTNIRRR